MTRNHERNGPAGRPAPPDLLSRGLGLLHPGVAGPLVAVFNVDQARAVIVLKRSMNPGFAGIENDLFVRPNTMIGDAKKTLREMLTGLKGEG